jgi:cell division transport system ATP-binding protein
MTAEPTVWLEDATIAQYENIILSDVSLSLLPGEFVYLIGKTGSGKSSLLKVMYGDLPLNQGMGKVCGFDLKSIKSKTIPFLRRKLGIVFQDFELLTDRSVDQNLLFVLKATGWKDKKAMQARMKEVLGKVGLENKGYKKPHELSGGEQQRVAIARALLNDPELILADEPTGNLDPDTSNEIIKLLIDISQNGKTVLMATHDHILMQKFPSRTIKCEAGKLLELEPSAGIY